MVAELEPQALLEISTILRRVRGDSNGRPWAGLVPSELPIISYNNCIGATR